MKSGVILLVLVALVVLVAAFACPALAASRYASGTNVTGEWRLGAKPASPQTLTSGSQKTYQQAWNAYTSSKGYQLQKFLDNGGYTARGYKFFGAEKLSNGHVRIILRGTDGNAIILDSYQKAGSSQYAFQYVKTEPRGVRVSTFSNPSTPEEMTQYGSGRISYESVKIAPYK